MTDSQRDQTGERNLNTNSGPPADNGAGVSRTAVQTPPPVEQEGADPRGTTGSLETKDNGAARRDQLARENSPAAANDADTGGQLFAAYATSTFRTRWDSIQTRFVDQPTQAVKEADALVTEVVDGLTRTFASER
jgi:hypothetical protein